jgi:hypothetical protein
MMVERNGRQGMCGGNGDMDMPIDMGVLRE